MSSKRKPTRAQRADRHALYQAAVQEPAVEIAFFRRAYRGEFGVEPRIVREDFCGTHFNCCAWVARKPENRAIGVDCDPDPLEWGVAHNQSALLPSQRARIELHRGDVRDALPRKADVVLALNMSYWVFHDRDNLRGYFAGALANLRRRGVLVLDAFGGPESMTEDIEDERKLDGATYIWEQRRLDPVTHLCQFQIHFRFRDGSELRSAFRYDWRFWSLPELRELLLEAGFRRVDVYWEGTDRRTGEGNGVYRRVRGAANDPAWVSYLVAVKR